MKVFITGMNGFLGSYLARALGDRGHEAFGNPALRIGDPADARVFEDADTIIHAAYDMRPGSEELNVSGAKLLFDAASGRRRIFISSHSARADAVSEYGRSKYRIERFYLEAGETVVRPGLVIGAGGLFSRQLQAIRSSRLIPLVDGGRDEVPVLGVFDFAEAMVNLFEGGRLTEYNLFNEKAPSMRQIVETVLRMDARRASIVPIPYGVARAAVWAAERLRIPIPFNSGSLRTLKLNRTPVHESNMCEVLRKECALEDAIALALTVGQAQSGKSRVPEGADEGVRRGSGDPPHKTT